MTRHIIIAALIAVIPLASQALTCMPRDRLVKALTETHGEHVTGAGLMGPSHMLEVWSAPSGNFTAFVTRADGISCIKATGKGWQVIAPPPIGEPG